MTEIFIDGKPVTVAQGTSFKLVVKNPLYSSGEAHTLEMSLPLAVAANRALFGCIDRADTPKPRGTYRGEIRINGTPVLTGTARVTSVTQSEVKLQVAALPALTSTDTTWSELYIDELDLGEFEPRADGTLARKHTITAGMDLTGTAVDPGREWTFFPTVNASDDCTVNAPWFQVYPGGACVTASGYMTWQGDINSKRPSEAVGHAPRESAQPYLWMLAERIARATGIELSREDNGLYNDPFLRRIFTVNACNSRRVCMALPHWTVEEWWAQLRHAFGLSLTADAATGRMRLVGRAVGYADRPGYVRLDCVADDFTCEASDESPESSTANVGFSDFGANAKTLLDEGIIAIAKTVEVDGSSNDGVHMWQTLWREDELEANHRRTVFDDGCGHRYIYRHPESLGGKPGFQEVDIYRPRGDREHVDVELKIVPAPRVDRPVAFQYMADALVPAAQSFPAYTDHRAGTVYMPFLLTESRAYDPDIDSGQGAETASIAQMLNDPELIPVRGAGAPDLLHIAVRSARQEDMILYQPLPDMHHCYGSDYATLSNLVAVYHQAVPAEGCDTALDGTTVGAYNEALSLQKMQGVRTLYQYNGPVALSVEGHMRHCLRFISDTLPDVNDVFYIGGQTWVCEKLEADITPDGFKRLMTGYFFPLDLSGG